MGNNDSRNENNAALDRMFGDPELIADADRVKRRARERRSPAMFAWAAPRRAAAAELKRQKETSAIREAGEEERGRPRSKSAYGGRKNKTLRRGKKSRNLRTRRTRR